MYHFYVHEEKDGKGVLVPATMTEQEITFKIHHRPKFI